MITLALACGKSPPDRAPDTTATSSPRAPADAARWRECAEAQRAPMEALLLHRYHLDKADEWIDGLTCVTLQLGPEPAYFVELIGETDGQRRKLHGVLALDGTTEAVPMRDIAPDWVQLRGSRVWFETADLDGDGTDELIVHRGDARQPIAEWIDVIAIRGTVLRELAGPRISYEDPDIDESCRGKLAEVKAGRATHLVVTVSTSSGKSDHCLPTGRHEIGLEGEHLVER